MTEQVESNLVAHARRELELIGEDFAEQQLRVVKAFADCGHSGGSAEVALAQLVRLLQFENLAPLTDDPAEWEDRSEESGYPMWQNVRNSKAFSEDGGRTYFLVGEDRPGDRMRTSEHKAVSS